MENNTNLHSAPYLRNVVHIAKVARHPALKELWRQGECCIESLTIRLLETRLLYTLCWQEVFQDIGQPGVTEDVTGVVFEGGSGHRKVESFVGGQVLVVRASPRRGAVGAGPTNSDVRIVAQDKEVSLSLMHRHGLVRLVVWRADQ